MKRIGLIVAVGLHAVLSSSGEMSLLRGSERNLRKNGVGEDMGWECFRPSRRNIIFDNRGASLPAAGVLVAEETAKPVRTRTDNGYSSLVRVAFGKQGGVGAHVERDFLRPTGGRVFIENKNVPQSSAGGLDVAETPKPGVVRTNNIRKLVSRLDAVWRQTREGQIDGVKNLVLSEEEGLVLDAPESREAAGRVMCALTNWIHLVALVEKPVETRFFRLEIAYDILAKEIVRRLAQVSGRSENELNPLRKKLEDERGVCVLRVENRSTLPLLCTVAGRVSKIDAKRDWTLSVKKADFDKGQIRVKAEADRFDAQEKMATWVAGGFDTVVFDRFEPMRAVISVTAEDEDVRIFKKSERGERSLIQAGDLQVLYGSHTFVFQRPEYEEQVVKKEIDSKKLLTVRPGVWRPKPGLEQLIVASRALADKNYAEVFEALKKIDHLSADRYVKQKADIQVELDKAREQQIQALRQKVRADLLEAARISFQVKDAETGELRSGSSRELPNPEKMLDGVPRWIVEGMTHAQRDDLFNVTLEPKLSNALERCKEAHKEWLDKCMPRILSNRPLAMGEAKYVIDVMQKAVEQGYVPNSYDDRLCSLALEHCKKYKESILSLPKISAKLKESTENEYKNAQRAAQDIQRKVSDKDSISRETN